MNKYKKIVKDILYLSKITKTKNKKILIVFSVALSQLTALSDILLIAIFSALIVNQFTTIEIVNNFLNLVIDYKFLIIFIIIAKYTFQYLQGMILKRIELNVNKNLKIYFLNEIFDKRNYSVADSYFYINTLTMHISYFYSSFANFLNSLFQILVFSTYLVISDSNSVIAFSIGIVILFLPIKKMLSKARMYMHESYERGQESSKELQRVVDNLFLIKILKKENYEKLKFENTLEEFNFNLINNHRFGIFNTSLPGLFTLLVLSTVLVFTNFGNLITLDFVGVTLRLFQSLSLLTTSINQIINSHVHIEKFDQMEQNKFLSNRNSYTVDDTKESNEIVFEDTSFSYFNSDEEIFKNVSFSINKNSHVVVTGPNGSGKSTLLGLIAGVLYATEGNIRTFSDKFGYIGATPLIFEATIYENITYGNKTKPDNEEILNFMKKFDLFKEDSNYDLNKMISNKTLSSGQMQKIAFIRALLSDIEILLLDEATANLDKNSKKFIFELLRERGITIINSTHDPNSFGKVDMNLKIKIEDEARVVEII